MKAKCTWMFPLIIKQHHFKKTITLVESKRGALISGRWLLTRLRKLRCRLDRQVICPSWPAPSYCPVSPRPPLHSSKDSCLQPPAWLSVYERSGAMAARRRVTARSPLLRVGLLLLLSLWCLSAPSRGIPLDKCHGDKSCQPARPPVVLSKCLFLYLSGVLNNGVTYYWRRSTASCGSEDGPDSLQNSARLRPPRVSRRALGAWSKPPTHFKFG